jgi:hypothetical protein
MLPLHPEVDPLHTVVIAVEVNHCSWLAFFIDKCVDDFKGEFHQDLLLPVVGLGHYFLKSIKL